MTLDHARPACDGIVLSRAARAYPHFTSLHCLRYPPCRNVLPDGAHTPDRICSHRLSSCTLPRRVQTSRPAKKDTAQTRVVCGCAWPPRSTKAHPLCRLLTGRPRHVFLVQFSSWIPSSSPLNPSAKATLVRFCSALAKGNAPRVSFDSD